VVCTIALEPDWPSAIRAKPKLSQCDVMTARLPPPISHSASSLAMIAERRLFHPARHQESHSEKDLPTPLRGFQRRS
jgi:hypothetical protein